MTDLGAKNGGLLVKSYEDFLIMCHFTTYQGREVIHYIFFSTSLLQLVFPSTYLTSVAGQGFISHLAE
uniref:Uncharacterized protein n=1 Tax=Arundo donax TaxID=35708 RepID=A0A0A9K4U2_ARUDO